MKERNENLHPNNFHYPITSFGRDNDVIFLSTKFWMHQENGRILGIVLTPTFSLLGIQLDIIYLES